MDIVFKVAKKTGWEAYGRPLLKSIGLYTNDDLSYGRTSIPFSGMESRLYAQEDIDVWYGKVMMPNGKDWCWYQVWQHKSFLNKENQADVLFVHGTGVHSGTLAGHARRYLEEGFRLIVPDLVSHGYSSGVHVYQRKMSAYTEGLHEVLHDVARRDDTRLGNRSDKSQAHRHKTFMLGLSFGGTVAMHYAMDYPGSKRGSKEVEQGEIPIDGLVVVGPILGYSPFNIVMPTYLTYIILALNAIGAGCMELTVPHKKCLDKDPKVYAALIDEDKRSHQGAFRVGHMLCINDAVIDLHRQAHSIQHPIFIQQGGQDRVACPQKTFKWVESIPSNDKRMTVYPVCQHVIYRKAKTEEEDLAGRVACIEDNLAWMMQRCSIGQKSRLSNNLSIFPPTSHSLLLPSTTFSFDLSRPQTPVSATTDRSFLSEDSIFSSGFSTPSLSEKSWESDITIDDMDETSSNSSSTIEEEQNEAMIFDHPLMSKTHSTTLPALMKMCQDRIYRKGWTLSPVLRPFDVNVHPNWTDEQRKEVYDKAMKLNPWDSFSR